MPEPDIASDGTVAPGLEPVRTTFEENFTQRKEVGAACAVYLHGEKVVDLWGGYRDSSRSIPWSADTRVLMFSATKGVAAAAMAHAQARGLFDWDAPVACYWPAFAHNGKASVTVRQLLAHQAGLAAIDGKLTPEDIADQETLLDRLAEKAPDWTPGTRHGYHAWSLGWYESGLLRRVDPEGRTLGRYFAEEIAAPHGIDFHFGLSEDNTAAPASDIIGFGIPDALGAIGGFPWRMLAALANPWSTTSRALSPFAMRSPAELNDPSWRALEIPAGVGIGQVRDVAKLFGILAAEPEPLGLDATAAAQLAARPPEPSGGATDMVLKTETAYNLGFWKPTERFAFGSESAFGATGAGGAFGFADPETGLGFAYAPNRLGTALWDDPRDLALRRAVDTCLS
jgi:CubicO group peptidase (beta-lactamase class C family)